MPHVMDGDPVLLNDMVHDTALGNGRVVELLLDNRFVVQFYPSQRRVTYRTDGVAANRQHRSLYWHDPVLLIPTKSEPRWLLIRRMCMGIVTEMRGFTP
jgi:hypothetical protein